MIDVRSYERYTTERDVHEMLSGMDEMGQGGTGPLVISDTWSGQGNYQSDRSSGMESHGGHRDLSVSVSV